METVTVGGEGVTVDLLLWRRYGVRGRTLVEATFAVNPGLAAHGAILPLGTVLRLPDPPSPPAAAERRVVTLFG